MQPFGIALFLTGEINISVAEQFESGNTPQQPQRGWREAAVQLQRRAVRGRRWERRGTHGRVERGRRRGRVVSPILTERDRVQWVFALSGFVATWTSWGFLLQLQETTRTVC